MCIFYFLFFRSTRYMPSKLTICITPFLIQIEYGCAIPCFFGFSQVEKGKIKSSYFSIYLIHKIITNN